MDNFSKKFFSRNDRTIIEFKYVQVFIQMIIVYISMNLDVYSRLHKLFPAIKCNNKNKNKNIFQESQHAMAVL